MLPEDRKIPVNAGPAVDGAASEDDICAICQDTLSEEPSTKMPCSHVYHVACVEKLRSYDIRQVCPTCRVDLPPGPEQLYDEAVRRWVVLNRRYGQDEGKPWRRIRNADDRRENAEMVRMMTEAAEQGHAPVPVLLGCMYALGQGVPQSGALAAEWYRKAADQGDAYAQCELGCMYKQGDEGVPQSDVFAVKWWRKAADQGDAQAQCNLGIMYHEGMGGLPQSDALAVKWYRKAAGQGDAQAQFDLGFMYNQGRGGLRQSDVLAVKWWRKAADQGHVDALKFIKQIDHGCGKSF
jgi:TPR repeat protein